GDLPRVQYGVPPDGRALVPRRGVSARGVRALLRPVRRGLAGRGGVPAGAAPLKEGDAGACVAAPGGPADGRGFRARLFRRVGEHTPVALPDGVAFGRRLGLLHRAGPCGLEPYPLEATLPARPSPRRVTRVFARH